MPRVRRRRLEFIRDWTRLAGRDRQREWYDHYLAYRRYVRRRGEIPPLMWLLIERPDASGRSGQRHEAPAPAAAAPPEVTRRVRVDRDVHATLTLHRPAARGGGHTWSWELDGDVADSSYDEAIAAAITLEELRLGLPPTTLR